MRTIQRILVAVKSPGKRWSPAGAKASQIARATGARLELFHCVDTRIYTEALATYENGIAGFEALQRRSCEPLLEELAKRVRLHGVMVTSTINVDFPVHEAILRRAEKTHADLIVTDGHLGSHLAPSLWRFTDWELMRLSPVPLLIVKQPRLYHRPQVLAALDPNHAYAKPAQLDTDILNLSTELGGALHGQVHAIHAFAPAASSNHPSTGATAGAAIQTDLVARQTAAASLDTLLKGSSVAVDNRHLVCGHPADVLARGASALEADILVLGCICRSGVRRLMIGNTAEHLIYRVPCDLLLVKPAGFANDIEHERRGPRLMVTPVCN